MEELTYPLISGANRRICPAVCTVYIDWTTIVPETNAQLGSVAPRNLFSTVYGKILAAPM